MVKKRIANTVADYLCHTCGACYAVCPADAIEFRETTGGHLYPRIDEERCTGCGLCYKVCAGAAEGPALQKALPEDPFTGECLGAWVGRSTDDEIYSKAQSGGVVSQILIDLLEAGEVDACAVVKMVAGNPPRPVPFLARTREEVLEAQKSKYCPVPMLSLLKEAKQTNIRIAMVGLACHFHGLAMLQEVMEVDTLVKVKIGLVCDRTLSLVAMDYFLKKTSMQGLASHLTFKDKTRTGYPGDVSVSDEAGNVSIIPKSERMAIKDFFTPARCRICFDKMNVLGDVTVGDPWGIEGAGSPNGESAVAARTETGLEAVRHSLDKGSISLRPIEYDDFTSGQGITKKREDWRAYCGIWAGKGLALPSFFETVAKQAGMPRKPAEKHRQLLDDALKLNGRKSRTELLSNVRRSLAYRKARELLLKPARAGRKIIRKVKIKE